MTCKTVLVDARNYHQLESQIVEAVTKAGLIGVDLETEDSGRHDGLNQFMRVDEDGRKAKGRKLVFDINRTTICGLSLYPDGHDTAYYFNLNHADKQNRLPWKTVEAILKLKSKAQYFICHNAPFEITMMKKCYDFDLEDVVCTLQMCVSAYGPDEYSMDRFLAAGLGAIAKLLPQASRKFAAWDPMQEMNSEQAELFHKVVAKESDAEWSYNGFVNSITWGYGLKQAVKSWFGYQMQTFEETLGDNVHMGQLTGEQVVSYGCDDAYWCVRLFHRVLQYMQQTNPKVIKTFFEQENPMIYVYSEIWRDGIRIDRDAVETKRQEERAKTAEVVRSLKAAIRDLLPFDEKPHEGLMKREEWYQKNWQTYRNRLTMLAQIPDVADDYQQCRQISGAVSNAWSEERGDRKSNGPNLTHYMTMRTMLYDLMRQKCIVEQGKVQSDAAARGKLREKIGLRLKELKSMDDFVFADEIKHLETCEKIFEALNSLAGIEQRMKLYLTPYTMLIDPDTSRMYPVVTSQLATRRMAGSVPNTMQLAKHNPESAYIRGFYLPDELNSTVSSNAIRAYDDHVIVSIDWSQIELVLIGDFSGDPEFARVYGKIPYDDLHLGTAAMILSAIYDVEVTEEMFKSLATMPDDVRSPFGFPLVDHTGREMTPKEAYKWNRGTPGGKGGNFGYWYSGALSSVAAARGVGPDLMWKMTEAYRARFAVAEQWRVNTIEQACMNGYVELPDGHRRYKFECTPQWMDLFRERFAAYNDPGIFKFGNAIVKKINARAKNQAVNALIQGSCATIAKRSILKIRQEIKAGGWDARFKMPIHDELVWSVNRREAADFIEMAKGIMCNHPDIIKTLPMNATASVGRTFQPYSKAAPKGQIELDEAPALPFVPPEKVGKKLDRAEIEAAIDYLFWEEKKAAA